MGKREGMFFAVSELSTKARVRRVMRKLKGRKTEACSQLENCLTKCQQKRGAWGHTQTDLWSCAGARDTVTHANCTVTDPRCPS